MGKVWLIVLGTMLCTGSVTWIWHLRASAEAHAENQRREEKIRAHIAELEQYRDILRAEGVAGAEAYLFGATRKTDFVEDMPIVETEPML